MPHYLYSEDDLDDQEVLRDIIHSFDADLEMVPFLNGKLLVQYLEQRDTGQERPGFVVLDVNTPVWNGLQTLEALKKLMDYATLPVILISTSRHPGHLAEAIQLGAVAYLIKPGTREEMNRVRDDFQALCKTYLPTFFISPK